MATKGKKISEQSIADSVDGNEIIPFAKNGDSGSVSVATLKTYIGPDLSEITASLNNKVDKVAGLGLSTNDFSDTYKDKVDRINPETVVSQEIFDSVIENLSAMIQNRVMKEVGKGLSSNDYDNESKTKLDSLPNIEELEQALASYQPLIISTDDIRAEGDDNGLYITQNAKLASFDDMWRLRAGSDGEVVESGTTYALNGLELSYAEALCVMADSTSVLQPYGYIRSSAKTFFRPKTGQGGFAFHELTYTFKNCPNLKVANMNNYYCTIANTTFQDCPELHTIICNEVILGGAIGAKFFLRCPKLQNVKISRLDHSVSLEYTPLLSYDSVSYLITKASNSSAITVTVHADVYAKLTGDTTNEAAAALTESESTQWQALVDAAAEKQISFTSA